MAVMEMEFFPQRPDSHPVVYAYELLGVASHKGYITKTSHSKNGLRSLKTQ